MVNPINSTNMRTRCQHRASAAGRSFQQHALRHSSSHKNLKQQDIITSSPSYKQLLYKSDQIKSAELYRWHTATMNLKILFLCISAVAATCKSTSTDITRWSERCEHCCSWTYLVCYMLPILLSNVCLSLFFVPRPTAHNHHHLRHQPVSSLTLHSCSLHSTMMVDGCEHKTLNMCDVMVWTNNSSLLRLHTLPAGTAQHRIPSHEGSTPPPSQGWRGSAQ